ncbi:MAG: DUF4417 domain-containing protein, partial [Patescibacteria group bacterium]|nr:DUF4417 domain-containing protein [Patescibacteria group bacterium]
RPIHGNWSCLPGNFDPLHALELLPSDNEWGIPAINGIAEPINIDWFMAYDDWRTEIHNKRKPTPEGAGVVHFFMDDYRFEPAWKTPAKAMEYLEGAHFVLSPDFSLYRDHPPALWLWNIYRSRWLGAHWQQHGMNVIPTVSWSGVNSFPFCFLGLPKNAVLAISTVGVSTADETAQELFRLGYTEMCRQLEPVQVICYGERFPVELEDLARCDVFPPYQMKLRELDKRTIAVAPDTWE